MPQPNLNKMMKQVQQMQADMMKAQEQLKDEVVEASAGGGMVTVKVTGDLEVKEIRIDPAALGEGRASRRRTSRCSRTWCSPPSTRRSAPRRSWRTASSAASRAACGDLGLPGSSSRSLHLFSPPVNRLITELSKLPGIGQRTAQRLAFHILRTPEQDAFGLAAAIKEVKERIGLCEVCFNLAEGPRCGICQDERRDRR